MEWPACFDFTEGDLNLITAVTGGRSLKNPTHIELLHDWIKRQSEKERCCATPRATNSQSICSCRRHRTDMENVSTDAREPKSRSCRIGSGEEHTFVCPISERRVRRATPPS